MSVAVYPFFTTVQPAGQLAIFRYPGIYILVTSPDPADDCAGIVQPGGDDPFQHAGRSGFDAPVTGKNSADGFLVRGDPLLGDIGYWSRNLQATVLFVVFQLDALFLCVQDQLESSKMDRTPILLH